MKFANLEEEQIKLEKMSVQSDGIKIAAEKFERIEQMNDFADHADDLEGWVTTKVCFPCHIIILVRYVHCVAVKVE